VPLPPVPLPDQLGSMATILKRRGKRGVRYTARVRVRGREVTDTFATKTAAENWAKTQELAITDGKFRAPVKGSAVLADVIDEFRKHRKKIGRPPGASFDNALERVKRDHGLETLAALDVEFWRQFALDRIGEGAQGQTVASDLIYMGSVLRAAQRAGKAVDASAPGMARVMLKEDGIRIVSKERKRRITDDEIEAILTWFDANKERTSLPMRDICEFALATAMRRGEIVTLQRSDIEGRVMRIKRKHPIERDRVEEAPLLAKHADWPRVDPLEIIARQPDRGPRIFPYLGDTISFWLERACEATGIKNVSFHVFRHEALSRLAERGFDPLRLALVGGHRDLRNVKRYAKLDAARLANEWRMAAALVPSRRTEAAD
jgi:integrase